MSCNCNKAKSLVSCITTLTIGTGANSTAYKVIFKTPTGRLDIFSVTSTSTGLIKISDKEFRIGDMYEVWVSLATASNIQERATIQVGGQDVTCLQVQFDVCSELLTNQTITLL